MMWLRLVRGEIRKLTTTKMPLAFLAVIIVLAGVTAAAVVWGTDMDGSKTFISTAADQQSLVAFAANALMIAGLAGGLIGHAEPFAKHVPLQPWRAIASSMIFVVVVAAASLNIAPIAACAFAGAVLLILMRVITADEAYQGLRPEVLMLIAGMIVLGIALDVTGLAGSATQLLIGSMDNMSPLFALAILYAATTIATAILSNATVAVLFTPMAVSIAEAFAVSPRPFLVAIMVAGSAAFATTFGNQTNVIVYQMGGYNYLDFMKVGIPLNVLTGIAAVIAIGENFEAALLTTAA